MRYLVIDMDHTKSQGTHPYPEAIIAEGNSLAVLVWRLLKRIEERFEEAEK